MKREIFIGKVGIGGTHPVSIQSMTNTPTIDTNRTLHQINVLHAAGCEIVRIAIPDHNAAEAAKIIYKKSPLPVVADIHFDSDLALKSIEFGAHGLRINPGNIGAKKKVKEILKLANQKNIPIRIGVNAGSIGKARSSNTSVAQRMVDIALDHIHFFEDNKFFNIKISLKASNIPDTIEAYEKMDLVCDYPLHLGITEAGTFLSGSIKSAIGIGTLLLKGIGNTIRVSLTDDPVKEIQVAREILSAVGYRKKQIEIISCPTCARTSVQLISFVNEVEKRVKNLSPPESLTVAVMGCEVNGPGEASHADIGLAFSKNRGYLFKKGVMVHKVTSDEAIDKLIEMIQSW